jgi:NADPH-dependent 2,4-dienoyl-CoA reductase/sulfur reductase-like enzyme
MNAAVQRPSVVVIGGGYAGIGVAAALDEDADVTLVERRDTFVHNVGAVAGPGQAELGATDLLAV